MTPSKNDPMDDLLLSPPVPRTMAPSWCIGAYPPRLGSAPLYQVVRPPDWALPPLIAYVVVPLFLTRAVTNVPGLPLLLVSEPLAPAKSPFSRSAWTQGPDPEHGANQHSVPKLIASMWPLPVSVLDVSALPKSKQHKPSTCVPLVTMYAPWALLPVGTPLVTSLR